MTSVTEQSTAQRAQPQGPITIRPLLASDDKLLDEMYQRISPASLYDRYLQFRRPTPADIAAVCTLAPESGAALVATVHAEQEKIVGLAYYVREIHEAVPTAEPAILVEDEFQGQGIGRVLWQQLQQAAKLDGIYWLRVLSLPMNQRLARLVQGSGLPYAAKFKDGLREHLIELNKRPQPMQTHLQTKWRCRPVGLRRQWSFPQ